MGPASSSARTESPSAARESACLARRLASRRCRDRASFSPRRRSAVALSALLLAFFAVTGPPVAGSPWFERGPPQARTSWRRVLGAGTALTLHGMPFTCGQRVATAAPAAVYSSLAPDAGSRLCSSGHATTSSAPSPRAPLTLPWARRPPPSALSVSWRRSGCSPCRRR